mmetsp:Transcript_1151/g.1915  ORF Transcript_1151/g.1915 Transcript_1151/m.1915 type:complete len:141 (+) Transcript_1151:116-538(+)
MTTFNPNADIAPEMEIIGHTLPSYDTEGLDDVAELPFGNDAEEHRSSNQTKSLFNKRNKFIAIAVLGTILLVCVTGFSTAAMTSNGIMRSFQTAPKASKAPKQSKAPKAKTSKGPSATKTPSPKSTKAPTTDSPSIQVTN